jgi:hypothetical protein
MPLADIVTVVIRLFAIQTLVQAVGLLASATASVRFSSPRPEYVAYIPPAALLIIAIVEWALAAPIGRVVTRGHNPAVQLGTLSRQDLYTFAFVFLGLYFVLVSIAPTITWLHYYLIWSGHAGGDEMVQKSFYDLARHVITFAAGLLTLLPARKWSDKLMGLHSRNAAG